LREAEELKHRSNVVSREIGEAQRRGENVDARKEEMGRAGFSPRFRNFTKSEY
jgi:hypothetical protein